MNIHEFQAKQLFVQFGIPVPKGKEIKTPLAAEKWAAALNTPVYVVKAQIHAGGRGKAGGVKITKTQTEVPALAKELLGKTLVTHQTGPKGRKVRRLLIEEGAGIAKELYLSLLVDRDSGWPVFIASTEGGMEIEEVAAHTPEKIVKEPIDPAVGYQGYNGRNLAFGLGLPAMEPTLLNPFVTMLGNLYRLFMEKNASLVEINPLVITQDKTLIALDGKVSFDDNGLFKHPDVQAFRDLHDLVRSRPDVSLVFRHYPLDASCNSHVARSPHPDACLAACAAECAGRQGRFWEYHDVLFENNEHLERESLFRYARELGLDVKTFAACLDDPATRTRIGEDVEAAARVGVNSTPTLFFNGRTIVGALPERIYYDYALIIEQRAGHAHGPQGAS